MDGLTIRNGQSLLDTGKTASETRASQLEKPMLTPDAPNGVQGKSFVDTLKEAVAATNELQKDSDVKMQELATGKTNDIPTVMMAAEKADISLRLMTQVRNKIIDAYQDIMKMQV